MGCERRTLTVAGRDGVRQSLDPKGPIMPQKIASPDAITDGHGRAMLSIDDVATNYLGCSTRHVQRLADSGRMPRPIKLGTLIHLPRAVIEQWIAEGCPNNASKGGQP